MDQSGSFQFYFLESTPTDKKKPFSNADAWSVGRSIFVCDTHAGYDRRVMEIFPVYFGSGNHRSLASRLRNP